MNGTGEPQESGNGAPRDPAVRASPPSAAAEPRRRRRRNEPITINAPELVPLDPEHRDAAVTALARLFANVLARPGAEPEQPNSRAPQTGPPPKSLLPKPPKSGYKPRSHPGGHTKTRTETKES